MSIYIIFNSLKREDKLNLLTDFITTMSSRKISMSISIFDNINDVLELVLV
ncbi:MAG: hypothetical protein IJR82_03945 [Bacilli bacterium]|nr:hypothetical protein [Bacilli bacterium]